MEQTFSEKCLDKAALDESESKYSPRTTGSESNSCSPKEARRVVKGIKIPRRLSWIPDTNIGDDIVQDCFRIEKQTGEGGSSSVFRARDKDSGKIVAIKRTPKHERTSDMFDREATMLYSINHPGVIKFLNAAIDSQYYYLVLEYADCGNLLELAVRNGNRLEESVVATILYGVLKAVEWLHSKDVVHRDLKLENVMFRSTTGYKCPVLVDFEMAMIVPTDQSKIITSLCGTPYYAAPEKWHPHPAKALKPSDLWSIGVMAYGLVIGLLPFSGSTPRDIKRSIDTGKYSFYGEEIQTSDQFKDFVIALLLPDYNKRITVEQALKHPWISRYARLK